ncbi:hypothetical protein AURDEDRAFT_171423 [Auricularia subglabra TFB-10046 SS5]|nr:hypothetical protein AURDEDRAFT_171423 [Auricularia subglabra TFB-10046 SS5]
MSDIHKVTMDDFVVFTVAPNTPYKRIARYKVPTLYLRSNECMAGYRCRVTNVQPNAKRVGKPQSPVWCEGEPDKCVKGPKKMSIGFQREGNTLGFKGGARRAGRHLCRQRGYHVQAGAEPDHAGLEAAAGASRAARPRRAQADKKHRAQAQATAPNPTTKAENAVKPTTAPVNVAAPPKPGNVSSKRCPAKVGARSLQSPGAARFRHRRSGMSFLDRFHV